MKRSLLAFLLTMFGLGFVLAEDKPVKVETVVGGLNNPCGVAVQPGTGVVYVSDSAASRIVRIVEGKIEEVVVGFPKDVYGKGPMFDIGPLGLAFWDKETLVVADGGFKDGEEYVRVYTVPAAGAKPLDFDKDAKAKTGPIPAMGDIKAEGNLYGLALGKNALYVTCNGDDTKGWIARAELNGTKVGPLTRYIATKEAVEVDAPVAITMSAEGDLVVGQMGEINKPKDGLLTFYSAKTGKKLANFPTDLYDITGLAYSPQKGKLLYATDFAWMATGEGGLFRLDKNEAGVKAHKITALDKPTALAFAPDGTLNITVIGTKKDGDTAPSGALLKIAPGL